MIGTAVDAPGDAPRSPAIEPSDEATTSVPNWMTGLPAASRFMICTRWPAVSSDQSRDLTFGANCCSASTFLARLASSSPIR